MRPRNIKLIAWSLAGALVLGGAGAALLLVGGEDVEQLGEGLEARDRAARNVERIVEDLEEIAADLEGASSLPGRSEEIRDLTTAQRDSIQALAGLLREQLRALERTFEEVERTRTSTAEIAALSAEQARALRDTTRILDRLRGRARRAGAASGELARLAVYGARLAEESRDAFSEP